MAFIVQTTCLGCLPCGNLVASVLRPTGVISALGDSEREKSNDFVILITSIRSFFLRHSLSERLEQRLTCLLLYRWQQIKANVTELVEAATVLEQLPPSIRYEAVLSLTQVQTAHVGQF